MSISAVAIIVLVIVLLIVLLAVIAVVCLAVSYFTEITSKLVFRYANEDKKYLKALEGVISSVSSLGTEMISIWKGRGGQDGETVPIVFEENRVMLQFQTGELLCEEEVAKKMIILRDAFGAANLNRIVFHGGRVAFCTEICWYGYVYSEMAQKPSFLCSRTESFKIRVHKIGERDYFVAG